MTARDLINQRRRWFSGIWSTGSLFSRIAYIFHIWSLVSTMQYVSFFQSPPVHLSANIDLLYHSTFWWLLYRTRLAVLPRWTVTWHAMNMAQHLYSVTSCSLMQYLDAGGVGVVAMIWHALFAWMFLPVYGCIESMIKFYAIMYPPRGFHIVNKV